MVQVKITITTLDGEVLETLVVWESDSDQPANELTLARRVTEYIDHRFERDDA